MYQGRHALGCFCEEVHQGHVADEGRRLGRRPLNVVKAASDSVGRHIAAAMDGGTSGDVVDFVRSRGK
jgi:hypothetical protein